MRLTYLFIFLIPIVGFAQDLIIKKDSSNIYGRIFREEYDRIWIAYKDHKTGKDIRQPIPRSEILKYKKTQDWNKTAVLISHGDYPAQRIRRTRSGWMFRSFFWLR